jgi:hypothetical protein
MSTTETQSVVEKALGKQWHELSTIIKRHYDLKPGGDTEFHLRGTMDEVYHSRIGKLFLLPGRIFGALVPYKGNDIPTVVKNWTSRDCHQAMYWHRQLYFPGKSPVTFQSRMEHRHDSEIIEYVSLGLGIRLHTFTQEGALHFRSLGYVWKIGPLTLHIPNWVILGDAEIVESAISKEELYLEFNMIHPWFGKTFAYSGRFEVDKD